MLDEVAPDLPAYLRGEVAVGKEEVNTRLESVIDVGGAVGSQEKDALVVLEFGEEDYY